MDKTDEQRTLEYNYKEVMKRINKSITNLEKTKTMLTESIGVITYGKDGKVLRSVVTKTENSISQLNSLKQRMENLETELVVPWKAI